MNLEFNLVDEIIKIISNSRTIDTLDIFQQLKFSKTQKINELVAIAEKNLPPIIRIEPNIVERGAIVNYDTVAETLSKLAKVGKIKQRTTRNGELEYTLPD